MNAVTRSSISGGFRRCMHLAPITLGIFVSLFAGNAIAVFCNHVAGPLVVGAYEHVSVGNNADGRAVDEPYTIDWGDGTTTTGIAHPIKFFRTRPYVHWVFGTHTYSAPLTGVSIGLELNGQSCNTNAFDVVAPPPPPPPPPSPAPSPPPDLPSAAFNVQGLWWGSPAGSESGWGISLAHQGDTVFAFWFTYDVNGRDWWLVMTTRRADTNTYAGAFYEARGPSFDAVPFDPAMVTSSPVGTGTLAFSDANSGTFTYTVDGVNQTKPITRQVFGTLPTCVPSAISNLALATNFQDLWWAAPARSESGWSISLSHQDDTIFAAWATYDSDGSPLWLAAFTQRQGTSNVYTGRMYRTSGPRFDAFDASAVKATPVGEATFTFTDGNSGTFVYATTGSGDLPAVTQTKHITRFLFGDTGGTVCQ